MDGVKPSMAGKLRFHTYNFRHHQFFICVFFMISSYSTRKKAKSTRKKGAKVGVSFYGLSGFFGLYRFSLFRKYVIRADVILAVLPALSYILPKVSLERLAKPSVMLAITDMTAPVH